ncbi:MAG: metallophosphoesterase family protein [Caldicoprobacterales bacterium]|jgi:putative phosphoesterase
MIIGVISDTHGRITNRVLKALQGSDLIIHAGDIGNLGVLDALNKIAPVYGVRGNTDRGAWAQTLPMTQMVEAGDKLIYVIHNIAMLDIDPKVAGVDVIIYGHSHIPKKDYKGGIIYFNPGSAGPKRFTLPISLGRIRLEEKGLEFQWVDLEKE